MAAVDADADGRERSSGSQDSERPDPHIGAEVLVDSSHIIRELRASSYA
jgi:hypothetical protein